MIDIHNHLLPGIDDGSKSMSDSIKVLKKLKEIGFDTIILTPHYINQSKYSSNRENNIKLLEELKEEVKNNDIDIKLYLGNEIYYDENIYKFLREKKISTLNDSKYLLIEIPMSGIAPGYEEVFDSLIKKGYKVILAHPERYYSFQSKYDLVEELYESGILFQCNLESILGSYGLRSKKLFKRLLKEKKISFLATDIHHNKRDFSVYDKAKKKICKYITEEEYKKLLETNHLFD